MESLFCTFLGLFFENSCFLINLVLKVFTMNYIVIELSQFYSIKGDSKSNLFCSYVFRVKLKFVVIILVKYSECNSSPSPLLTKHSVHWNECIIMILFSMEVFNWNVTKLKIVWVEVGCKTIMYRTNSVI